ncbi:MAG: hypothetical protein A2X15_13420 [Bacteroidetes bacterium GWB2_32_14]|nr:MAG: hypothetical protein A2X15_13420 [Bacteroidetes bacterium GWB2_32_14]
MVLNLQNEHSFGTNIKLARFISNKLLLNKKREPESSLLTMPLNKFIFYDMIQPILSLCMH